MRRYCTHCLRRGSALLRQQHRAACRHPGTFGNRASGVLEPAFMLRIALRVARLFRRRHGWQGSGRARHAACQWRRPGFPMGRRVGVHRAIGGGHAAPVHRIMLPVGGRCRAHGGCVVAAPRVDDRAIRDGCIVAVVVIVVDVDHADLAARPVEPAEQHARAHADTRAMEKSVRESRPWPKAGPGRPMDRRPRGPPPSAIDHQRVVVRHVGDLRIGLFQHQYRFLPDHADLLVRLQVTGHPGTVAQALHRLHHPGLLVKKCVAQLLRPVDSLVHHRQQLRECHQCVDTRVPAIRLGRAHRLVTPEMRIRARQARGLPDFERVGRGHQYLRQQRIGIERDRRQHLVQTGLRKRRPVRHPPVVGIRHRLCKCLRKRRECGQQGHQGETGKLFHDPTPVATRSLRIRQLNAPCAAGVHGNCNKLLASGATPSIAYRFVR